MLLSYVVTCFQSREVLNFSTAWPSWAGVLHGWQGTPPEAGSKTGGGWGHRKGGGHTTLKGHVACCCKGAWNQVGRILLLLLFSCAVVSDSLRPHGLHHTRLPCPSPSPGACSNSCPLSRWCHPTISSSVVPFSSCLQSFPASESFIIGRLFASGGQSIGASASASVLLMNIQGWFPLGLTGLISLQPKRLSRIFNITAQKHPLFFHKGI